MFARSSVPLNESTALPKPPTTTVASTAPGSNRVDAKVQPTASTKTVICTLLAICMSPRIALFEFARFRGTRYVERPAILAEHSCLFLRALDERQELGLVDALRSVFPGLLRLAGARVRIRHDEVV